MDTTLQDPTLRKRRIKTKVNKPKKQVRELCADDRSLLIEYLNATQDVLDPDQGKGDGECKRLCDMINFTYPNKEPIAEYQVAGFIGWMVRAALQSEDWITKWWQEKVKKGKVNIDPRPVFSTKFIERIAQRQKLYQQDEEQRRTEHAQIKAKRAAQESLTLAA